MLYGENDRHLAPFNELKELVFKTIYPGGIRSKLATSSRPTLLMKLEPCEQFGKLPAHRANSSGGFQPSSSRGESWKLAMPHPRENSQARCCFFSAECVPSAAGTTEKGETRRN